MAANKSPFHLSVASPDLSPHTRSPSAPRETLQHQLLVQEHEGPDMPLDAGAHGETVLHTNYSLKYKLRLVVALG